MSAISDLRSILKNELNSSELGKLTGAFNAFVSGTAQEKAAAEAIAGNAKDAIQAYMQGQLSRSDLDFVLANARDGALALVDAKALRLKKAALKAFFAVVTKWLMSRI